MALATVSDYVSAARTLLQDTVAEYRYADTDLLLALSLAHNEAKRVRPDMFISTSIPTYTVSDSTAVTIDERYRLPFLYFVVGWVTLKDDEETQDSRAAALLNKFVAQLTGVA